MKSNPCPDIYLEN